MTTPITNPVIQAEPGYAGTLSLPTGKYKIFVYLEASNGAKTYLNANSNAQTVDKITKLTQGLLDAHDCRRLALHEPNFDVRGLNASGLIKTDNTVVSHDFQIQPSSVEIADRTATYLTTLSRPAQPETVKALDIWNAMEEVIRNNAQSFDQGQPTQFPQAWPQQPYPQYPHPYYPPQPFAQPQYYPPQPYPYYPAQPGFYPQQPYPYIPQPTATNNSGAQNHNPDVHVDLESSGSTTVPNMHNAHGNAAHIEDDEEDKIIDVTDLVNDNDTDVLEQPVTTTVTPEQPPMTTVTNPEDTASEQPVTTTESDFEVNATTIPEQTDATTVSDTQDSTTTALKQPLLYVMPELPTSVDLELNGSDLNQDDWYENLNAPLKLRIVREMTNSERTPAGMIYEKVWKHFEAKAQELKQNNPLSWATALTLLKKEKKRLAKQSRRVQATPSKIKPAVRQKLKNINKAYKQGSSEIKIQQKIESLMTGEEFEQKEQLFNRIRNQAEKENIAIEGWDEKWAENHYKEDPRRFILAADQWLIDNESSNGTKSHISSSIRQKVETIYEASMRGFPNEEIHKKIGSLMDQEFAQKDQLFQRVYEQARAENVPIADWDHEWAKNHYNDDPRRFVQAAARWLDNDG